MRAHCHVRQLKLFAGERDSVQKRPRLGGGKNRPLFKDLVAYAAYDS